MGWAKRVRPFLWIVTQIPTLYRLAEEGTPLASLEVSRRTIFNTKRAKLCFWVVRSALIVST